MTDERDYQAEFDALANVPDEPDKAQPQQAAPTPEPEVGTSETARSFAQSGVFADLVAEQQKAREEARQRAIAESQGYTFQGLREASHKALSEIEGSLPPGVTKGAVQGLSALTAPQAKEGILGKDVGMLSPEERKTAAQEELDFRQKSAPFTRGIADSMPSEWTDKASEQRMAEARADVDMGHTVRGYAKMAAEYSPTRWLQRFMKGSADSVAAKQETALKAAQSMAKGEIALPDKAWWRDKVETGAATVANFSTAYLIQYAGIAAYYAGKAGLIDAYAAPLDPWDNKLTKFGRDLEAYVNELFPGDKARQYEFAKAAAQGVASTITFGAQGKVIGKLLGGGPTGINAAIALSGAAAQTPEQFKKVTEALNKGNATETDRLIVFLANSALGSSEVFGIAPVLAGRGTMGPGAAVRRGLSGAVEESLQETGQQYGQNLTAKYTYNPAQDPYEGVAEGAAIGFLTGGTFGAAYSQIKGAVEAQEALAKAKGLGLEPTERPVRVAKARGGTRTDVEPTLPMPAAPPPEPQSGAPVAPAPATPPPLPQAPAATPPPVPSDVATPPIATQIPDPDMPAPGMRPQRTPPALPVTATPEAPAAAPAAQPVAEPAVALPPDVADFIAKTAPELAQRYGLEIPGLTSAAPPAMPEQVIDLGTPRRIVTPDGSMEVEATPEIVELDSLRLASGALQPRDRSRAESDVGIRERAVALDPARLMPGRVSDNGAPMVSADGTILSGNGRALSIAQVYRDPALKAQADSYRAALGPQAANMREPVLVSRLQPMAQAEMVRFADLSNRPAVAAMGATERAVRDARAASDDIMGLYQGGAFTSPQNRAFFQAFNNQVVSSAERGAISRNGMLTKEGEDRMSAAVLAAAYGDPELLARMLESADDTIRSITGALRDAAGAFIRLKAAIRRGEADAQFDITPQVAETARTIARLRETGTRPDAFLDQQDAFNPTDPIVAGLIRAFYNDNVSRQLGREKLTEILTAYAEEAAKHRAEGLIPDETSVEDIVRYARSRALGGAGADQGDLLAGAAGSLVESSTSAPGGPDAGSGRAPAGSADAAGGLPDAAGSRAPGAQVARSRLGKGLSEIAAQSTGQAAAVDRISEGATPPPLPQQPDPAQQAQELARKFVDILAGKAPRSQWAQLLGTDEAGLQPFIDDAIAEGLLRLDRNGKVARTRAAKPVVSMAAFAPRETISVPADVRLDAVVRTYQAATGQVIRSDVRVWAEALEGARGAPEFGPLLGRLAGAAKAGEITKADALQLASLVGYPPTARTTKGEALASIEQRNADLEASRAMQAATDMVLASVRGTPNLDMSPEARKQRAEKMGFDTSNPLYRGMSNEAENGQFSVNEGDWGRGVYLGNRSTASGYAYGSHVEGLSPLVYGPLWVRGPLADVADHIDMQDAVSKEPQFRRAHHQAVTEEANRRLQERGYTGITQGPNMSTLVFDPSNIRSVNATFDPALEGSPLLLASIAGTPAASVRAQGVPLAADPPLASYTKDADIKAHPDYAAAKAGDRDAAVRFVPDVVKPETIEAAARRFGRDAIYVPVIAEEAGGRNQIPEATAHYYAAMTGAQYSDDIAQVSRAFHTGARPMDRLVSRPLFDGDVVEGGKYVLVDDVSVMGGTIAEMANFIQSKGGVVAGVVTLVNASRNGVYAAKPEQIRKIEARYGETVRQEFGVEPAALTADEAQYILNFRDADALRGAVSKGRGERQQRLLSKGVRTSAAEGSARGLGELPPIAQALYSVSPRVRNARFKSEQDRIVARIRDEVTRMVPPGIVTRIMDHIVLGGVNYNGYYNHADRLIALSLAQGEETMLRTLRHEMVHVARQMGLFTDAEFQTLLDRAKKLNIDDQITMMVGEVEVSAIPHYREHYGRVFRNAGLSQAAQDAAVEELINQERVAKLAEIYDGGAKFGTTIDRLLARIREFFNAVRRALNMEGYVTADDIFEKLVSGEIADRARQPVDVQAAIDELFDADPIDPDALIASAEGQVALEEARRLKGSASARALAAGFDNSGAMLFSIAGAVGSLRNRIIGRYLDWRYGNTPGIVGSDKVTWVTRSPSHNKSVKWDAMLVDGKSVGDVIDIGEGKSEDERKRYGAWGAALGSDFGFGVGTTISGGFATKDEAKAWLEQAYRSAAQKRALQGFVAANAPKGILDIPKPKDLNANENPGGVEPLRIGREQFHPWIPMDVQKGILQDMEEMDAKAVASYRDHISDPEINTDADLREAIAEFDQNLQDLLNMQAENTPEWNGYTERRAIAQGEINARLEAIHARMAELSQPAGDGVVSIDERRAMQDELRGLREREAALSAPIQALPPTVAPVTYKYTVRIPVSERQEVMVRGDDQAAIDAHIEASERIPPSKKAYAKEMAKHAIAAIDRRAMRSKLSVVKRGPAPASAEGFADLMLEAAEGRSITADDLYDQYLKWVESIDDVMAPPVMTSAEFSKAMRERGLQSQLIAGRKRWIGVALKDTGAGISPSIAGTPDSTTDTDLFPFEGGEGRVESRSTGDGRQMRIYRVGGASVVVSESQDGGWAATSFAVAPDAKDATLVGRLLDAAEADLGRPLSADGWLSARQQAALAPADHTPAGETAQGVTGSPRAQALAKAVAAQAETISEPPILASIASAPVPSEGAAQRRDLDTLGFYSAALEAAKALKQAKGTPEQMRAMLRSGGAKEAELLATGLDAWLAERARAVSGEEAGRSDASAAPQQWANWTPPYSSKKDVAALDALAKEIDPSGTIDRATAWAIRNHIRGSFRLFRQLLSGTAAPYRVEDAGDGIFMVRGPGSSSMERSRGAADAQVERANGFADVQRQALRHAAGQMVKFAAQANPDHKMRLVERWGDARLYASLKEGDVFVDPAFASAENNVRNLKHYDPSQGGSDAVLRIKTWSGLQIEGSAFERDTSLNVGEREVLIPAGQKFRVTKVETNENGLRIVSLEELPPQAQRSDDRTERQPDNRRSREPIVTKDEIIRFLEENRVEVKEATYRAEFTVRDDRGDWVEGFYNYRDAEAYAAEMRAKDGKSYYVEEAEERQPRWQTYSIDPENPTYREDVMHLPERTNSAIEERLILLEEEHRALTRTLDEIGWNKESPEKTRLDVLDAEARELHRAMGEVQSSNFRDLHWEEPNPVGHIRSQIILSADGRKYLNGDNIQSAWQQAYRNMIRDGMALEMFNSPFKDLMDVEKAAVSKEIARRRKAKEPLPGGRDEAKIDDLRKRHADARADTDRVLKAVKEFLAENQSHVPDAQKMVAENNPYHQVPYGDAGPLEALVNYGPREVSEQAATIRDAWADSADAERRIRAELHTAEQAETVPAHALIETTDLNLNFMLKRFLRQAVDAGVDGISFTPGHVLSSRGEGDDNPAAMAKWMDETVPRAMRDLLRTYDKSTRDHVDQSMKSPVDGRTFTQRDEAKILRPSQEPAIQFHTFPLTDAVKLAILSEGQPLFSVAGKPPAGSSAGSSLPGEGPGLGRDPQGLTDIIADLKAAIGMPVTQGLSTLQVRDAANGRTWRFRPKKTVRGQYETPAGVARVRLSTDIETLAEQGGRHIEMLLGQPMQDLLVKHSTELAVYGGSMEAVPAPEQVSDDFAKWFRDYILEPDTAQQTAPRFHEEFEKLMDGERPDLLERIDLVQTATLTKAYQDYKQADDLNRAMADLASDAPRPALEAARQALKELGQDGTISGMASQVYTALVDENHPHRLYVKRLLEQADLNGLRDDAGKPISLATHENPYRLMRSLQDSYKTGLRWIQDGMPHYRHADAGFDVVDSKGRVIQGVNTMAEAEAMLATLPSGGKAVPRKGYRSASLHDALSLALGKNWTFRSYQRFGNYLVSRRAVEEWKVWEAKLRRKQQLLEAMDDLKGTLSATREDLGKTRAKMSRRETKTIAGEALVGEFERTLQRLINAEAADVAVMSDPASSDLQVENAQQRLKVTRRELNRYEQKYQAEAARTGGVYNDLIKLDPAAAIMQAKVAAGEEQLVEIRKELRELAEKGLQRPPHRVSREDHDARIARWEAANPQFAQAAEMVYDFVWQSAVHDFEAGRLTQEELDYRETRRHFYVPFARSVPELEASGLLAKGRAFGSRGMTPKFAKDKAFKGSDRDVYNPIEIIIAQAFHRAAATHLNDAVRAYVQLSDYIGPGASALGERVVKSVALEANEAAFATLERKLQEDMGLTPEDAREQAKYIEADFGSTHLLLTMDTTAVGPAQPLNITFYENGERKLFRINDPELAAAIVTSVNGMGREMSSLLIDILAKPSAILRWGVTAHPAFGGPNLTRDSLAAFMITGRLLDPRTYPVVTQIRGLAHEIWQTDFARMYQESAGLMGGQNVAALPKVKDKKDVFALEEKGMHLKPGRAVAGILAGGGVGFMMGGPLGAGIGAVSGLALHRADVTAPFTRGIRLNIIDTLSHIADMSETATRLGVASYAYAAALKQNPNLTPYQAMQEAAFTARDIIDFGRRGSRMLALTRTITFLNSWMQGLDKMVNTLITARSDRGAQLSTSKLVGLMAAGAAAGTMLGGPIAGTIAGYAAPATAANLAARVAAVRALMMPLGKKMMGHELSDNDQAALGLSARAWVNLLIVSAGFSLIPLMYAAYRRDDDDEEKRAAGREYQRFLDQSKFKATPVKVFGQWVPLYKPFEWGVPSNIFEAAINAQLEGDPRFRELVLEGLRDVLAPPGVPQALRLREDIHGNYDSMAKRPIVPQHLRELAPQEQFNAYSSHLAISLSRMINENPVMKSVVEGGGSVLFGNNFQASPMIIDYALRQGFGYYGKDAQKISNVMGASGPKSEKITQYPLIGTVLGRFALDPNARTQAMESFWKEMTKFTEGFPQAAATYKIQVDRYSQATANQYLATLDEDKRAYALIESGLSRSEKHQHPFNRLRDLATSVMDLQADMILDRIASTDAKRNPVQIPMTPAKRDELIDLLNQTLAIEAENTMITMKYKQFKDRKLLDPKPVMDTLRASSPDIANELDTRLRRKKVQDFADVARDWPEIEKRVLHDWQEAMDEGREYDSLKSRRLVKPPIGAGSPAARPEPKMLPRRSTSMPIRDQEQPAALQQ